MPTELDSIEELEEILQQQDTVVTEIVELTPINKEATTIESNLVAPMGLPAIYQYLNRDVSQQFAFLRHY